MFTTTAHRARHTVRRTQAFGLEIGLHRRVVCEVVLAQVGESRLRRKWHAAPPWSRAWELSPPMGRQVRCPPQRLSQLALQQSAKAVVMAGRGAMAGPTAVDQGAEQGAWSWPASVGGGQVLDPVGVVGFAHWCGGDTIKWPASGLDFCQNAAASRPARGPVGPSSTSNWIARWGGCAAAASPITAAYGTGLQGLGPEAPPSTLAAGQAR